VGFGQVNEDGEVLKLSRKKFKWMVDIKLDSLKEILDDRLTYTHSGGWSQTRKQFLEDFTNGKLIYHSIDILDLNARTYPNGSAIVNGRGKFLVTLNGGAKRELTLGFTEMYILNGKKWKLVARHSNVMP